jgi:predicted DCC family thiol-disulfide oxidoreductase YuxK
MASDHLVFFDSECPLCQRAVRHVLQIDGLEKIVFAPLKGATAASILSGPNSVYQRMNTLILLENYQSTQRRFWVRSRAIFRIYWLIGGKWRLFGALSFLPGWLGDLFYRNLARHRHQFSLPPLRDLGPAHRFLP